MAGCSRSSALGPVVITANEEAAFRGRFGEKVHGAAEPGAGQREGRCSEGEGEPAERQGAYEARERHLGHVWMSLQLLHDLKFVNFT